MPGSSFLNVDYIKKIMENSATRTSYSSETYFIIYGMIEKRLKNTIN